MLREEFADIGVLEEMSCDIGSNLTSFEKKGLKGCGVKTRESSAHFPQYNGRAGWAVNAAKKLVTGNTTSCGSLNTDKFLQAS